MTNELQQRWFPTTVVKRVLAIGMMSTGVMFGGSLLGTSPTSAFAAPVKSVAAPVPAAVSAPAAGGKVSLANTGRLANRWPVCFFFTLGSPVQADRSAFQASGQGWWVNLTCRARWAVVTVQLQQLWSDRWRNVFPPRHAMVRSREKVTGRVGCITSRPTGWRSVIDVDLVGQADDPRKFTTRRRNIPCRR